MPTGSLISHGNNIIVKKFLIDKENPIIASALLYACLSGRVFLDNNRFRIVLASDSMLLYTL
jgi:hypothetical protein